MNICTNKIHVSLYTTFHKKNSVMWGLPVIIKMIDKKICHFAKSFCSQNKSYQLARTNIYMIKKISFLYILGPKLLVHWIKSNGWFDAMWFVKYLLRCIAYCIMHLGLYAFLPYQIPILNLQLEIRNEFIANFDVFF